MKNKKSKEAKEQKKRELETNNIAEQLYIDRVLPIIDFDEETGVGIMEDGCLCDCFSVVCKDLNSITNDQLTLDLLTWEKVYKTYPGDLKLVSFSFPADTKEQREYVEYKISKTDNPILKSLMKEKLEELEVVHRDYLTREAALFFFSATPAEYKKNFTALRTLLSNNITPLVKVMESEKKKKLFYKMCNKNLNH